MVALATGGAPDLTPVNIDPKLAERLGLSQLTAASLAATHLVPAPPPSPGALGRPVRPG